MAAILAVLVLLLIWLLGGCLVYTIISLYFAGLIALAVVFLLTAQNKIDLPDFLKNSTTSFKYGLAYFLFGVIGISLIILICCIKQIKIGIMVIRLTADFTRQECQSILVPLFMGISIAVFLVFWFFVSIYIISSGTVSNSGKTPFGFIDWNVGVKRCLGFYLFGLFWNCEVAIGMCQFVVASTTAYWYFSKLNDTKLSSPVCKSFARGLTYHLGSIVFGSLILCIFIVLQLFFEIFHKMSKNSSLSKGASQNCCAKCCG
jgi:hypothetical protein